MDGRSNNGRNPNSLANLARNGTKPGEVRNPTGKNGIRPYTDAMKWQSAQRLPENLRLAMNYKFKNHLFFALKDHPKFRITDPMKIPDLYPKRCTWAEANAIRQHLAAVLEGNIQAAVEVRESVEGRTTTRVEFVGQGDKLETLLNAFRMAAGVPDEDAITEIPVLPSSDGNTNGNTGGSEPDGT